MLRCNFFVPPMGKIKYEQLDKSKTISKKDVQEMENCVIEKCRNTFENKQVTKKNKSQGKKCYPKLSLDKVSKDIQNILGQMTKITSNGNKQSASMPIELKIQEKEFFKVETTEKNKTDKNNMKQKLSAQSTHSPSMNFYKTRRDSKETDSENGTASANYTKSGILVKKIPITRLEMQEFKRRTEMSAMEAIKTPELVKLIDKEKVARDVKDLMKSALDESVHIHEVPVIDIGKFINTSLKMAKSNDFPELRKIVKEEDEFNDDGKDEEESNGLNKALNHNLNRKNGYNKMKKMSSDLHPVGQTLKTLPNTKNLPDKNNNSIGQGQSKTIGCLIVKQKSTVQKNDLVKKQISSNNRTIVAKGSKGTKKNTEEDINVKVRSNSTLSDSQGGLMSTPVYSSSSGTSRPLDVFRNTSFGMKESSQSHFGGTGPGRSAIRRCADPVVQLKEEVNCAIRNRKTFTVQGHFPAVRKAMLKRGWVEKYSTRNIEKVEKEMIPLMNRSINQLVDLLHVKDLNEICKKLIKSKLLGSHQVDFYWGPNYDSFEINNDKVKLTKINKFRRDVFSYTSKQGLCDAAKDAHWFNFPGLARINHPRTYALAKNGETKDFIKDFRRTAAMSLLKWIIRSYETKECKIISSSGKIPLEAFQFACNECYKMVIEANNQDIDKPLKEAFDHEWCQFLEYYYEILHIGNHFKAADQETEETIVEKSQFLINQLVPHYQHIRMDGTMNIWILKPAAGSQGRGIYICRTLQYIMDTVKTHSNTKYIAQKYIERPLLIFNTKFDIRQWFLISCALPLTIWMYRECYLRFSSQTYNLRKLHESVHLTNNCVQKHYQNTSHDITLPHYNMWDSIRFKKYLSDIGYPDIYQKVIYEGMKECIIGAVMIHQDKLDKRSNCFELYGADFMLTEDFQPWLIEINSCPALNASTPITSRMCPQVIEDTIKVVVDYAANPQAHTGNFEQIYLQTNMQCNSNANMNNMKISGKPLPKDYFCLEEYRNDEKIKPSSVIEKLQMQKRMSESKSEILTEGVKERLENLLKFIQNEKNRRHKKKLVTQGTDPMLKRNTISSVSFANLKSSFNLLASSNRISFTKEDENLLDQALKMLKNKRDDEVLKYFLEMVERIFKQAPEIVT